MRVFHLGNLTFGGYLLFETPTEVCIMMAGDWQTVRIPKVESGLTKLTKSSQDGVLTSGKMG